MRYFCSVKSFEDLKAQYRALAMKNHPDRGGDLATMQAINAEYDALHARWNTCRASDGGYESAPQFRAGFYREQGWTGERYSSQLSTADLAVIFRAYVKKHWPQCRFSVTRKRDIFSIALMEAPFSPWCDLEDPDVKMEIERHKENPDYDLEHHVRAGYKQLNHFYIERDPLLSSAAKELFKDICAFVQSYNFAHANNSQYFFTNFYLHLEIGKPGKPFMQIWSPVTAGKGLPGMRGPRPEVTSCGDGPVSTSASRH